MARDLPKLSSFSSVVEHSPSSAGHLHLGQRYAYCSLCLLPSLFILVLLFLAAHFTISLHSAIRPVVPSFQIGCLNTSLIGISPVYDGNGDAYISAAADVLISIWNGEDTEVKYSESKVLVSAGGDALNFDEAVVAGFWQAAKSSAEVRVTAVARDRYLTENQVIEIEMAIGMGVMVMSVEWVMNADLIAAGKTFRRVPLNVACDRVNTSALLAGIRPNCTAKLFGLFPFT